MITDDYSNDIQMLKLQSGLNKPTYRQMKAIRNMTWKLSKLDKNFKYHKIKPENLTMQEASEFIDRLIKNITKLI